VSGKLVVRRVITERTERRMHFAKLSSVGKERGSPRMRPPCTRASPNRYSAFACSKNRAYHIIILITMIQKLQLIWLAFFSTRPKRVRFWDASPP
jgi:hypothetical protein